MDTPNLMGEKTSSETTMRTELKHDVTAQQAEELSWKKKLYVIGANNIIIYMYNYVII